MSSIQNNLLVEKITKSRIQDVDFSQLPFGHIFSDHMYVCDYENGQWQTPKIVPYAPFSLMPSSSVFHYGQAIFEGMKAYKDDKGDVFLFRPQENYARFNKSCQRMAIPEFPEEMFDKGLKTLIDLDRDWVKEGFGNALYIRPFVFATSAGVKASASREYKFVIITSPVQSYYSGSVKVKVADYYSRAANGGFGFAKAAGNYAGQFYPTALANQEGYQQVIWTDDTTHEKLEECGTMNVIFRIGNTLVTSPVSDRILDGVTRKSVLQLAQHLGIQVEIRDITIHEIIKASENQTLKEIFGCGTAAVISPVSAFNYKGTEYPVHTPEDSWALKIKNSIMEIQHNVSEDLFGWRVKI